MIEYTKKTKITKLKSVYKSPFSVGSQGGLI